MNDLFRDPAVVMTEDHDLHLDVGAKFVTWKEND